jgi:hypothetical protein
VLLSSSLTYRLMRWAGFAGCSTCGAARRIPALRRAGPSNCVHPPLAVAGQEKAPLTWRHCAPLGCETPPPAQSQRTSTTGVHAPRSKGSHGNHPSPLIHFPGVNLGIFGFEKQHLSYDILHTCDLGVSAVIAGSILAGLSKADRLWHSGLGTVAPSERSNVCRARLGPARLGRGSPDSTRPGLARPEPAPPRSA